MNKKMLIPTLAIVAVLGFAALATAGPGWHRGGNGPCGGPVALQQLNPEQQAAFDKIWEGHREKMEGLRNDVWAKHLELDALTNSGTASKGDIQTLVKDIVKLREKMDAERDSFRAELDKAGIEVGSGYGRGNGPCGGRGMGGQGSGPCGGRGMGGQGMMGGQGYGPCAQ